MIRILTDSAADLSAAEKSMPGLTILPLNVLFENGESVKDGVTLTKAEFYTRLLASEKLPRTSQPSPDDFLQIFEEAKAAHDETIVILISSTLSGTMQCARLAAAECEYNGVYFVDSLTATAGEAVLVREALRLRDGGHSAAEIVDRLEDLKPRICIFAVVDSLKHLHKGGRLPAAVAIVGSALGFKPILSLYQGKLSLADKARGRPGAYVALFRQIEAAGGVDPAYGYTLLYSDDKQVAAPIHHHMHANLQLTGGHVCQIGAAIGTHIGPGAAGICFVSAEG